MITNLLNLLDDFIPTPSTTDDVPTTTIESTTFSQTTDSLIDLTVTTTDHAETLSTLAETSLIAQLSTDTSERTTENISQSPEESTESIPQSPEESTESIPQSPEESTESSTLTTIIEQPFKTTSVTAVELSTEILSSTAALLSENVSSTSEKSTEILTQADYNESTESILSTDVVSRIYEESTKTISSDETIIPFNTLKETTLMTTAPSSSLFNETSTRIENSSIFDASETEFTDGQNVAETVSISEDKTTTTIFNTNENVVTNKTIIINNSNLTTISSNQLTTHLFTSPIYNDREENTTETIKNVTLAVSSSNASLSNAISFSSNTENNTISSESLDQDLTTLKPIQHTENNLENSDFTLIPDATITIIQTENSENFITTLTTNSENDKFTQPAEIMRTVSTDLSNNINSTVGSITESNHSSQLVEEHKTTSITDSNYNTPTELPFLSSATISISDVLQETSISLSNQQTSTSQHNAPETKNSIDLVTATTLRIASSIQDSINVSSTSNITNTNNVSVFPEQSSVTRVAPSPTQSESNTSTTSEHPNLQLSTQKSNASTSSGHIIVTSRVTQGPNILSSIPGTNASDSSSSASNDKVESSVNLTVSHENNHYNLTIQTDNQNTNNEQESNDEHGRRSERSIFSNSTLTVWEESLNSTLFRMNITISEITEDPVNSTLEQTLHDEVIQLQEIYNYAYNNSFIIETSDVVSLYSLSENIQFHVNRTILQIQEMLSVSYYHFFSAIRAFSQKFGVIQHTQHYIAKNTSKSEKS